MSYLKDATLSQSETGQSYPEKSYQEAAKFMSHFEEVALKKFDSLSETGRLYPTASYREASKEFIATSNELRELIGDNEELLKVYLNLDSAFGSYESYIDEKCFIRGFMEGVKFLNQLNQDLQNLNNEDRE